MPTDTLAQSLADMPLDTTTGPPNPRPLTPPPSNMTRLRLQLIGRGPMYTISAAANISPRLFYDYVHGKKRMSGKHLMALSRVLRVPPADLIGWVDPAQITVLDFTR